MLLHTVCNKQKWITHSHSTVFSLTVSSPSAISSSSSFSLTSLCSGASWPKSLLVMPLKENVRTIYSPRRGWNHRKVVVNIYYIKFCCSEVLVDISKLSNNRKSEGEEYHVPLWPAPPVAASWRQGPGRPSPAQTGSVHVSCTLLCTSQVHNVMSISALRLKPAAEEHKLLFTSEPTWYIYTLPQEIFSHLIGIFRIF